MNVRLFGVRAVAWWAVLLYMKWIIWWRKKCNKIDYVIYSINAQMKKEKLNEFPFIIFFFEISSYHQQVTKTVGIQYHNNIQHENH